MISLPRIRIVSSFILLLTLLADFVSAQQLSTKTPSKNEAEILKRFVDECVEITPGRHEFPQKVTLGVETPEKHEVAVHHATFREPFRISRYETTQELYQLVMGSNPSRWKGPRNSVETVSFDDVQTFCRKLTQRLRDDQLISSEQEVRLPTSDEWEYCCRAGSASRFSFGNDVGDSDTKTLDAFAWHTGNAAGNDPAVGVLQPNRWGLYDMHGYVWEYVLGPDSGDSETCRIRGGSWKDHHSMLTSATQLTVSRQIRSDGLGFRCVIGGQPESKNSSDQ